LENFITVRRSDIRRKKHGAVNMRATVTGEKTLRTMTLWSSQEDVEANLDKIRAAAGTAVGMSVTGAHQTSYTPE
jgi:hypothetical protein